MEKLQSPAGFRLSTGTSDSEDPRNDRVITDGMGQGTLQFCSFPGTQIISFTSGATMIWAFPSSPSSV